MRRELSRLNVIQLKTFNLSNGVISDRMIQVLAAAWLFMYMLYKADLFALVCSNRST